MEANLLDTALKGAVVLALTGAVAAAARSSSAAARHLVWSIGLAATAALPLLQWLLPGWDLAILPAPATTSGPTPAATSGPSGRAGVLAWLWLAGSVATLGVYLVGRARVHWIARRATLVDHGPWAALLTRLSGEIGLTRRVRLLRARGSAMPMMWGILRPTILLPREADGWSPALQRDVMLHELAHVQRHDDLTQTIARLACALHWFNPLAWLAARRMRLERERACDDRVIDRGRSPCEYAEHLLAVARWRSVGGALAMAGSSPLGQRLEAVLDTGRTRRPVPFRAALGQTTAAAILLVPLAALHPAPASAPPDARGPGGILPVPPSASAGLRPDGGSPRGFVARRVSKERSPRIAGAPVKAATVVVAPVEAKVAPEVSPAASVKPRAAPPVLPPSTSTATLRIVAHVRVETRTASEICSEPEAGAGDETPTIKSRTTLAAVPQSVVTP